MPASPAPDDREAGFTLIEILAGLAISSLIMVGLGLGSTSINRGFAQTSQSLARQGMLATGLHVILGDLARIERVVDNPLRPARFLFSGQKDEAIFLLAERPGNNGYGVYWVRYVIRDAEGGAELLRMRQSFDPRRRALPQGGWEDEVLLLAGDYAIAMSYRAPGAQLRDWSSAWSAASLLPEEIGIEIRDVETGRLRVPFVVQALRNRAEAECAEAASPACTLRSGGIIAAPKVKS